MSWHQKETKGSNNNGIANIDDEWTREFKVLIKLKVWLPKVHQIQQRFTLCSSAIPLLTGPIMRSRFKFKCSHFIHLILGNPISRKWLLTSSCKWSSKEYARIFNCKHDYEFCPILNSTQLNVVPTTWASWMSRALLFCSI